LNELKDAISNDKNVVFSKDLQGATPLHHAAFMGHLEIAKYLVKKGKILIEKEWMNENLEGMNYINENINEMKG